MPLIVRRIYPVYRQRRKLVAWTTVPISARAKFQQQMRAPGSFAVTTKAQFQQKAKVQPTFGLQAFPQFQQKMNVAGGFQLTTKAQWQQKAQVAGGYLVHGISQWQQKMQVAGGFQLTAKAQWQQKAQVAGGYNAASRGQWQFKTSPGLQFTVFVSNLVVIDDVYGSDAVTRINLPIFSGTASFLTTTSFYVAANKVLNSFDVFQLTFTKPDGTSFNINSGIQIGTQNFFSGVGRMIPNMFVTYVLTGTQLNQRGTWQIDLLVNNALLRSAQFMVA